MAEIRLLESETDLLEAGNVFRTAMVGLPFPPVEPQHLSAFFEPGRTWGAFDGRRLVGTTASYSGALTVPGGAAVAHAAVTRVGVLPTHTRRGLSRELARRQLSDARARGEAIATLRASDARIYGNFGYGVASSAATFEVEREKAAPVTELRGSPSVRLVAPDEAWDLIERIYREHRPDRPGAIDRNRYWWDFQKYKRSLFPGPAYVAVHGIEGAEDGFVRYHPVGLDNWFSSNERTLVVDDLVARNRETWLALVGHLLKVDLVHRIVFAGRPLDDPLSVLFRDHRAVRLTGLRDETWLRIVDVGRALDARSYGSDDAVVLEVSDALLPENAGAIRLSAAGAEPTNERPHARIDVAALAAAYLGGTKWWQLGHAGRVAVDDPLVIDRLDALFSTPAQPYSGTLF